MKKIFTYFRPQQEYGLYEEQRTTALLTISLIGFILTSFNIAQSIFSPTQNSTITILSGTFVNIFVIINLFMLKRYGLRIAGNLFALGLVVLLSASMNIITEKIPVEYKFHQGFYTIMTLFATGVLFASRKVLIINTIIILFTTTRVFLLAIEQTPEEKELFISGYFHHTISLLGLSSILYFAIKFAEKAIADAKKDAHIKAVQNQELLASEEEIRASMEELKTTTDALEETNEELSISKLKAEESDNLKTVFLTNMSHEIRTPLNGIIGFSNLLNSHEKIDETAKYYTEIISKSSEQLLKIIDDIIEISQLETKQAKIHSSQVNLNYILLNLIAEYKYAADKKGIDLIFETSISDVDSLVYTDEAKLRKILINLIENAIKFTKTGHVKLHYEQKAEHLEFRVEDTGIGFEQNETFNIFDRFVQADKHISIGFGGLGLGLGLSIAKLNTELLGGEIRAQSEQGKGSIFCFDIPYNPVVQKEPESLKK